MTAKPYNQETVAGVMMAVYNAGRWLRPAVESVLGQTHRALRLVMCDDGSTDDSWSVMQEFAARDTRVRLLRNERNLGVPATRNRMLAAVPPEAEALAVMDSDDVARPERLEVQLAYLAAHPEVAAVGASIDIIDEDGVRYASRRYPCKTSEVRRGALRANPVAHSTLCIRREAMAALRGYDEGCRSCEDYELLLRLLEGHEVANCPETLVDYRISRSQWKQRHLKDTLLTTLALQRRYLFRRRFASAGGWLSHLAKYPLLLLPSSWVLALFQRLAYRR